MEPVSVGFEDMDRYDRQRRIPWMDMSRISSAKVLVAGAGALGNEVVKDLVLAGFKDITVVDMDDIVLSNLNRCLFFRDSDVSVRMKSEVVAERASELVPDAVITPVVGRVQDVDVRGFHVILGCLDNILARMDLNSAACYYRVPYIDGATDGMRGKVQVVLPGRACLQCIANRSHAEALERRFTCTGNSTFVPHAASDITTTSVISAIQVREAMKSVSGHSELCMPNVTYYDGTICDMFVAVADVDPSCPNHWGETDDDKDHDQESGQRDVAQDGDGTR